MPTPAIALDAMGGDRAPEVPVAAALSAANDYGIHVTLVGDETAIQAKLGERSFPSDLLRIVDAPEHVSMEDEAVSAVRRKRRASIPVGLELLKSGDAAAFVSAGNTGAVVASATVSLGRLPGVSRPGIAIQIPTLSETPILLIDAGALVDPKPEHLWQHARLAAAYARSVQGIAAPTVGLISNGEEAGKGNSLTRSAHEMLSRDSEIEFIGNVETRAIPHRACDVVVTDGFTGNIVLKTSEAIVTLMQESLRAEFRRRPHTAILASMLKPAFRRAGRSLDYREYGGAPLLGVGGLVMIAHGGSDKMALVNALRAAQTALEGDALAALRATLSDTAKSSD